MSEKGLVRKGHNLVDVFLHRLDKGAFDELQQEEIVNAKAELLEHLEGIFSSFLPKNIRGSKVLVKPNLLKAKDPLCVTSWQMIACVAFLLKSRGARVCVADSPAFGNALQVLNGLGIKSLLSVMDVDSASLSNPVKVKLPCGVHISLSKEALDADLIINLPRLKAHSQMGVTGAVKNLYGTVPGFRKALYHMLYGKDSSLFSRIIIEIGQMLPHTISLMDAAYCMHLTGPTGGVPLWLGALGVSDCSHALDTAFYTAIGASPVEILIWHESRRLGIKGAFTKNIRFVGLAPYDLEEAKLFKIPLRLDPITFNPIRFLRGRMRSMLKGLGWLR